MAFALQYITRPGTGYGGYLVNDGKHRVWVPAVLPTDTAKLHSWLGNGNSAMGMDAMRSSACLSMPDVILNPAQYNTLVATCSEYTRVKMHKGDC